MKSPFPISTAIVLALIAIPMLAQSGAQSTDSPISNQNVLHPYEDLPTHIGGSVLPPKVLRSALAQLSGKDKGKYFGIVRVYLWVERNGVPSHLRVARGLGGAADQAVLVAAQKYRFQPAMMNGKPIKVDLYLDFQVY